nr:immunoglobulin light chain junction region [Macaca mulatta]
NYYCSSYEGSNTFLF